MWEFTAFRSPTWLDRSNWLIKQMIGRLINHYIILAVDLIYMKLVSMSLDSSAVSIVLLCFFFSTGIFTGCTTSYCLSSPCCRPAGSAVFTLEAWSKASRTFPVVWTHPTGELSKEEGEWDTERSGAARDWMVRNMMPTTEQRVSSLCKAIVWQVHICAHSQCTEKKELLAAPWSCHTALTVHFPPGAGCLSGITQVLPQCTGLRSGVQYTLYSDPKMCPSLAVVTAAVGTGRFYYIQMCRCFALFWFISSLLSSIIFSVISVCCAIVLRHYEEGWLTET